MADKKIQDFVVLEDAQNDDLILVSSQDTTYTMKVKVLKDAVEGMAQRAETAAQDAKNQISTMKETADTVSERALKAALTAENAAESAELSAQSVQKATADANSAAAEALAAKREADTAAESANTAAATIEEAKSAADSAANQANTAARSALEVTAAADAAAQSAQEAAANAQTQGAYAKAQGDRAAQLVSEIENTDVGGMAADILALQTGKADLVEGKVPEDQLPDLNFDPSGSAAAVQALLSAHTGNTANPHNVTAAQLGAVPTTRKVNGLPLSGDINLTPKDIGLAKQPCLIIGTSTNGHTLNDCDYLCDGDHDEMEIKRAYYTLHNAGIGGTIFLLPGTYNIDFECDLYDTKIALVGSGSENTILSTKEFVDNFSPYSTWNVIRAQGNVIGITIKYPYYSEHENTYAATFDGISTPNCLIYDVCTEFVGNTGTYMTKGVNIADKSAVNCFFNYAVLNSDVIVTGSKGMEWKIPGSYVTVDNCIFSNGHTTITGHHVKISGCIFESGNNFIPFDISSTYAVSICNCVIGGMAGPIRAVNSSDCSISNNLIVPDEATTNYGISVTNSDRIEVCGNTIYNKGTGIYMVSSNLCNISGNLIMRGEGNTSDYTSSQYTIWLYGALNTKNLISNNLIYGKNYVSGGGTGNTFVNNKYN